MRLTLVAAVVILAGTQAYADEAYRFPTYIDGVKKTQAVTPPKDQTIPIGEQSVFYQITYPKDWKERGLAAPMCNPCDHGNDGVTWQDYHDHLITRPDLLPRHVFGIEPAYNGNSALDGKVTDAYAKKLPVTSAVAANQLLTAKLDSGEPLARLVDFGFYYLSKVE